MRPALIAFLAAFVSFGAAGAETAPPLAAPGAARCVVLLHGLGRTRWSMAFLENRIAAAGFRAVNIGYDSRAADLPTLAEQAVSAGVKACGAAPPAFVTHSLGGVLLRAWLARRPGARIGKVVMLGPPNHGSAIVDALARHGLAAPLLGAAGAALGSDGAPAHLPGGEGREIGVIAGDLALIPFTGAVLDGPNDGVVAVASTFLDGAADHITLPVSHTFMMNDPMTAWQVLRFLTTGSFDPAMTYADLWSAAWPAPGRGAEGG